MFGAGGTGSHVVGFVASGMEIRRSAEEIVNFLHHFRKNFAGFRIGQTPAPSAGFKKRGIFRREIQHSMFVCHAAGHGCVSVQIDLRDHGDPEGFCKGDQPFEFRSGDHFFFPADERRTFKGKYAPRFQYNVVVFVIRRKTDHFFNFKHPRFREPADVNTTECQIRRIHDLCRRQDLPGRRFYAPFRDRKLPHGAQGISGTGKIGGFKQDRLIFSDLQIITFCGERFCKRFANDVKTDLPEKESIVVQDLFCAGCFRDLQCEFQTVFQRDERTVADRDGAWDRNQVGREKMFCSVCHGV